MTIRRTHHGDLDAHVAQPGDAIGPIPFDWGAPLEFEAKFGEELDGGINVFDHDADVVHPLDCHQASLDQVLGRPNDCVHSHRAG